MSGGLYISSDPLSDACTRLVEDWMEECVGKHAQCCRHIPKSHILPTRLVDVDLSDSTLEPKLILSDSTTTPYATLSHCWGKVTRTTTTQKNLRQMMQGIPMSKLSPNFRDAVRVARRLHIRYIWIDSLCIVQDCNDDWSRESAKMADIYKNSHLTIAATSAWDTNQGFLHIRERSKNYCELNQSLGGLFLRKRLRNSQDEILESPLRTRAWTFQEGQLSPRVLHFGVDQLIWQCQKDWHCESSAYGFDMTSNEFRSVYKDLDKVSKIPSDGGIEISKQTRLLKTQWYSLLEAFSRKNLTFLSDKLPAISALAHEIQYATNDDYIAGLWKSDLIRGLLWNRVGRTEKECQIYRTASRSDMECQVPSWSWAAVDEPVSIDKWRLTNEAHSIATIIRAEAVLHSQEFPLGRVCGGFLELSGPCKDIQVHGHVATYNGDNFWPEGPLINPPWEKKIGLAPYASLLHVIFDNDADSLRGGNYICMGLFKHLGAPRRSPGLARGNSKPNMFCLILEEIDGSKKKLRRVGMGTIDGEDAVDIVEDWEVRTLSIE